MLYSNGELAYGELAQFEIASGSISNIVLTGFAVTALAASSLVGGTFSNSQAQASAIATSNVVITAVTQTRVTATGTANLLIAGGYKALVLLESSGLTNSTFVGGLKLSGVMNAIGESFTDLLSLTDPGFDIASISTANFYTEALKSTVLETAGTSVNTFVTQSVINTKAISTCISLVTLPTASYQMAGVSVQSSAQLNIQSYVARTTSMQSIGQSTTAINAQAIGNAQTNIVGLSSTNLQSVAVLITAVDMGGSSIYSVPTKAIQFTGFTATGIAGVSWVPGRPLYTSLPRALDVVQHPTENRTTQHLVENRTTTWV